MDESVRRAMGQWPDVPAVYGWLSLDESGRWHLRGEPISHPGLIAFIGRNYACDERGRWFFQNGPQRGYVRLAYTPWVLHVDSGGWLRTHTGRAVERVTETCVDDEGHLLLSTDAGVGLVDAGSLPTLTEWLVDERDQALDVDAFGLALERLRSGGPAGVHLRFGDDVAALAFVPRPDVPARFGFVADPQPDE